MQSLLDARHDDAPGPLEIALRHKAVLFLGFAVGIALTLAYFSLAPRKYQSEAKIFLRVGRETVSLDPTAATGPLMAVADSRGSELFAIEEMLTSRPLAEHMVDEFGEDVILQKTPGRSGLRLDERFSGLNHLNLNPFRVYSLRDKAVRAFQESLKVSAGAKTNVVSVSYECDDPELAQRMLQSLMAFVSDEHLRVHRTKGSQEFFIAQADSQNQHLTELEERQRALKNESGVAALATQRDLQLQMIGSLQADAARARSERDAIEAELTRRRQQLREFPAVSVTEQTTGQPHSTDQVLRQKLYDLEIREKELSARYTTNHPQLIEIQDQLAEARRIYLLEKAPPAVKTGINQTHQAAELAVQEREAALVAVGARLQSLDERIAAAGAGIRKLNDIEVEVNRLDREIDLREPTRENTRRILNKPASTKNWKKRRFQASAFFKRPRSA